MSVQPLHVAIAAPAFLLGLLGGLLKGRKARRRRHTQPPVGSRAENDFIILPDLAAGKHEICSLALCKVFLVDDCNYNGWLVLVPQQNGLKDVIDLSSADQHLLWDEVGLACRALRLLFNPHKLNVAALGNKCPQLHVHVTARDPSDPAWPGPCYDYKRPKPYPADALEPMIVTIRHALKSVDH